MSPLPLDPACTIHLAVDMQEDFLVRLPMFRRTTFRQQVNEFAGSLRTRGVETLWIACGEEKMAGTLHTLKHMGVYAWDLKRRELGLHHADIIDTDVIIEKGYTDGFKFTPLDDYLQSQNITTLIVSGQYTRACVADTIRAALNHKYNCIVAYDKLADTSEGIPFPGNEAIPENHPKALLALNAFRNRHPMFLTGDDIVHGIPTPIRSQEIKMQNNPEQGRAP